MIFTTVTDPKRRCDIEIVTQKTPHPLTAVRRSGALLLVSYLAARVAACLAIADLRLAAWFLWMTPLLTALSS